MLHCYLAVVDPKGLPVEQVREALGPVALDDPLAAVEAREAVHVAAIGDSNKKVKAILLVECFPQVDRSVVKFHQFLTIYMSHNWGKIHMADKILTFQQRQISKS